MTKINIKRYLAYTKIYAIYYFALFIPIVFILWKAWQPGFLFTLDSQFTPVYNIANLDLSYDLGIIKGILYIFNLIFDAKFVQLAYFTFCLYLPVALCFGYLSKLTGRGSAFTVSLFLILNPFVYGRLVAGHIHLILVLGLIIPYIYHLTYQTRHQSYFLFFIPLLGSIITLHALFYFGIAAMWLFILRLKHRQFVWRPLAILVAIGIIEYFLLALKSVDPQQALITSFWSKDILSLLTMGGMWTEVELGLKPLYEFSNPVIWGCLSLFLIVAIKGISRVFSSNIFWQITLLTMLSGIFMAILSLQEFDWLYSKLMLLPGFGIMREGHKWLGLYVVGFVAMVAYGLEAFKSKLLRLLVIIALIVSAQGMFWLAGGQIIVRDYPKHWYELEEQNKTKGSILVLPWTNYAQYSYLDGLYSADATRLFFSAPVISARFPENMNYLNQCDVQDRGFCINYNSNKKLWDGFLSQNRIMYILIYKTEDRPEEASFIKQQLLSRLDAKTIIESENEIILIL